MAEKALADRTAGGARALAVGGVERAELVAVAVQAEGRVVRRAVAADARIGRRDEDGPEVEQRRGRQERAVVDDRVGQTADVGQKLVLLLERVCACRDDEDALVSFQRSEAREPSGKTHSHRQRPRR